jgi:signal peptidase I
MFDKWRRYSYAAQKTHRLRLLWIFLGFLGLYITYNIFTSFFFSMWVLENNTMLPGLNSGDRFVLSSLAVPSLLVDINKNNQSSPVKRGDIVLVNTAYGEKKLAALKIADGVVRFFSAQRVSLTGSEDRYLKRVIALPGDEVSMTNYVFRVKPAGSSYTLTEFELSEKPYTPNIPHVPALWDESIPFSGNMDKIVLAEEQCFVVSDDRSNTNDSRTWGPVFEDAIIGKVILRYWPITRFGRP